MTFGKKLWMTLFLFVIIAVGAAFGLAYMLYEKLYVESVKTELATSAKSIASDYEGGDLTADFIDRVNWFSEKSTFEAFAVHNPRELAACIPYEADYETLIGPHERDLLLQNEMIEETGYSDRFDRQIISVIYPLLDGEQLKGIVYLYIPLERIDELVSSLIMFWAASAVLLIVLLLYGGMKWTAYVVKPLESMKKAAVRLSKGDYKARVPEGSHDEFGQLARTFNEMAEAIEQEDEQRKTFIATVSHELRTPLSYIKGYSEAAIKGIGDQKRQLEIIHRESTRMERLVNDLLHLIRLEADKMTIEKTPIPLAEIVHRTVDTFRLKHPYFQLDLDEETIVNGDEGRLSQVMTNLLDNAIRYSEKNSPIQIELKQERKRIRWTVRDTGVGIPEEEIPKITNQFYRVNKARTRNDGGSGLGLSIVKQIVESHGGELVIKSKKGLGTTVTVILPAISEEGE
ncbi:sensor histidine kinase [Domibacillus enclensis]|uniref:histidine kinase n=1 Tax=Domibacillus enclensis TaxID=1017273 RepID=A0A1N7AZM5_9BACI|nr:HAMP domain-containing sensor histidine kinase [Domibacillus enclensis]OXS75137.1 two-component sensor histidine kinase [Domibacillus enclensis]SIR44482.1 Signal transduction histidine kinase [Domibacillus enclensis]